MNTDHERELLNIHKQDQCFIFSNLQSIFKIGVFFFF